MYVDRANNLIKTTFQLVPSRWTLFSPSFSQAICFIMGSPIYCESYKAAVVASWLCDCLSPLHTTVAHRVIETLFRIRLRSSLFWLQYTAWQFLQHSMTELCLECLLLYLSLSSKKRLTLRSMRLIFFLSC